MAVLCHLPNSIVCHSSFLNPSKCSFRSNGALVFLRWPTSCPDTVFGLRLFPASHLRPETAFTFDVLEHFHIDAMECKTATASFIKKALLSHK
jgi:hypothetical protein